MPSKKLFDGPWLRELQTCLRALAKGDQDVCGFIAHGVKVRVYRVYPWMLRVDLVEVEHRPFSEKEEV